MSCGVEKDEDPFLDMLAKGLVRIKPELELTENDARIIVKSWHDSMTVESVGKYATRYVQGHHEGNPGLATPKSEDIQW